MDSKAILTVDDGLPDVSKVQEGETPLQALERFFSALDESLPASERQVTSASASALGRATRENKDELAALKTKLADTKTKLADTKTKLADTKNKLADLEIELDNLNRQISEKELEIGKSEDWFWLCSSKIIVAKEWKDAGLIGREELLLFLRRFAGITDHELYKAIQAYLKEKRVVKEKATEENGENYEPPACTRETDMVGPTTPILAGSEQHGENSKARGTDGQ